MRFLKMISLKMIKMILSKNFGVANPKNYFIGEQDAFDKLTKTIPNLIPFKIVNNITPIEIKNLVSTYNRSETLYIGFPRIYNYKNYIDKSFSNQKDDIMSMKDKIASSILNSMLNEYIFELHSYCAVFSKLKETYTFNLVDTNNTLALIENKEEYEIYQNYVKTLFNDI
jgi:hypothetical protein